MSEDDAELEECGLEELYGVCKETKKPEAKGKSGEPEEEEIKLSGKMVEIPLTPEGKAQEKNETACPNLQPMAEWIKKEDPGVCRPCALAPVVQWYWDELKERGLPDLAKRLEQKIEKLDEQKPEEALALCEELDQIKKEVPPELKARLQEFDCAAQLYDPLLQGETGEEASPQSPSA